MALVPEQFAASVARTVIGNVPSSAVVPANVPLANNSRPVGSVPVASANVTFRTLLVNVSRNDVLAVAEVFPGFKTTICLQQSEMLLPVRVAAPSRTSARPERL